MSVRTRLDGAVPPDPGASRDVEIAALTRRVAELEHRLDVMKVVIGLVLAAKVVLVAVVVYVLLAGTFGARSRVSTLQAATIAFPAE